MNSSTHIFGRYLHDGNLFDDDAVRKEIEIFSQYVQFLKSNEKFDQRTEKDCVEQLKKFVQRRIARFAAIELTQAEKSIKGFWHDTGKRSHIWESIVDTSALSRIIPGDWSTFDDTTLKPFCDDFSFRRCIKDSVEDDHWTPLFGRVLPPTTDQWVELGKLFQQFKINRVIEVCAGKGYIAKVAKRELPWLEWIATDLDPGNSHVEKFEQSDAVRAKNSAKYCLFIGWPPYLSDNEKLNDTISNDENCEMVIYVGEEEFGCTGYLFSIDDCGSTEEAAIWQRFGHMRIPQWICLSDHLYIWKKNRTFILL